MGLVAGGWLSVGAVEDGDHHTSGGGVVGGEAVLAGAHHEAVFADIGDAV